MNTKTLQINHLIKTLAEQIRHAESFNGMWGMTKERAEACKAASKTVADLEKLGVHYDTSFDKAVALTKIFPVMTTNRINQAIRHLGLEIVRGQGYQYFCDLETGAQVGESVLVCYLNQCNLQQWVKEAEDAKKLDLSSNTH